MLKRTIYVFILYFLGSIILVQAETKSCDHGELSDIEYNNCLFDAHKMADERLNIVYKKLMATLGRLGESNAKAFAGTQWSSYKPDGMQKVLRKAQLTWIKYRDNNCNYYMELHYPGSASLTEELKCKLSMTKDRAYELESEERYWGERYTK